MKPKIPCPTCGQDLSDSRIAGYCPHCAWESLMESETEDAVAAGNEDATSLLSIPGYQVLSEIARGGMGIVYLARQLSPRREVALKMLLPHQLTSPVMRERFRTEAQAIAGLNHPGILPVFQTGEFNGIPFFTMRLAPGGSLADRKALYARDWRAIAKLIARVADAVNYAHQQGVIHRDLKPGNILFDVSDTPFVSDFGLAKILSHTPHDRTAQILGTPQYLAPEAARGGPKPVTPLSDQYGLGAILFELLTGKPPFDSPDMVQLLRQIGEGPAPDPRALDREIPQDLAAICHKALSTEPSDRYASMQAMAADLRAWLEGRPVEARPAGRWDRFKLWVRRHTVVAVLLTLVALLLCTLFAGTILAAARLNTAREEAEGQLWHARRTQARALRQAHQLGARREGLALLTQAPQGGKGSATYDEWMAHLPLLDVIPLPGPFPMPEARWLRTLSFDPDLRRMARWSGEAVEIIDLLSQAPLLRWRPTSGNSVSATYFNPNGLQLLIEVSPRGPFELLDLTSGNLSGRIETGTFLGFGPEGKELYFRDEVQRRAFQCIDAATGRLVRSHATGPSLTQLFAFDSDGTNEITAFATSADIQFQDLHSGTTHSTIRHVTPISSLTMRSGVVVCGNEHGEIQVWDLVANHSFLLEGHKSEISRTLLSEGGRWLFSTSVDGETRIWDTFVGELCGVTDQYQILAIDRRGDQLILGNGLTFQRGLLESGRGRTVVDIRRPGAAAIRSVQWSPIPSELLISRFDGIALVDVNKGRELAWHALPGSTAAHFMTDGSVLAAERNCLAHLHIHRDKPWPFFEIDRDVDLPDSTWLLPTSVSSDGRWIVAGYHLPESTNPSTSHAVSVSAGRMEWPARLEPQPIKAVHIEQMDMAPGATWFAYFGERHPSDPIDRHFHTTVRKGLHLVPTDSTQKPQFREMEPGALRFSPDGRFLAISSVHATTILRRSDWNVEKLIPNHSLDTAAALSAWSADGSLLAVGKGRDPVEIWRTSDWQREMRLESPNPQIPTCMNFHPDGSRLAVGTDSGRIEIWEFAELNGAGSEGGEKSQRNSEGTSDTRPLPPLAEWHWPADPQQEARPQSLEGLPRDPRSTGLQLDLSTHFNALLDGPWPFRGSLENTLSALPRGLQTFGGIPFEVRGVLVLNSRDLAPLAPDFPWSVTSIPVSRKCTAVHFLQCTGNGYSFLPRGLKVAEVRFHYEDGSVETIPIRLQIETADWWYNPSRAEGCEKAPVVWTGINAASEKNGRGIRLYALTWNNPHPAKALKSIALESAREIPSWMLLGITLE